MKGVHLFVPMLHRRDAVGEHTIALRDRLRARGVPSCIYTELPDPATVAEAHPYRDYEAEAEAGDVLVYQLATGSEMAGWLASRPEPLVVNFHSITPPEFFAPWNDAIARLQVEARQRLTELAPRTTLAIATSEFTADELRQAGYATITVVPPVAGVTVPPLEPSTEALASLRSRDPDAGTRWLSVGRLAPNKAHHQTVAALFVARATTDPGARLTVIGSPAEPAYASALKRYAAMLGLSEAVEFLSGVSDDQLATQYHSADVLVMLSDHEGFGVPLVEAMGHGLPIVAFAAGSVGEVLGGAGVLLDAKRPRQVAMAVAQLMADPSMRDRLIQLGRDRFEAIGTNDAGNLLVEALLGVLAPGASHS